MGWFFEILRTLSAKIDWGIYNLAETIYKVFVAITNTEIINAAEIQKFTNRVYVIIGAFMIFKVALAMLKYLVNPDSFSNSGTGYNKLIWNICTALILLVMMPTIYNYAMRIQNTVVNDGIIERLVLGTSGENNSGDENRLLDSGPKLSFTILSAFVMPDYDYLGLQNGGACTDMYGIDSDTGETILNEDCRAALEAVVDEADKEAVGQYSEAIRNNDINLLLFGEHSPLNARLSGEHTEPNEDYTFLMKYRWGISWIVGIFLCFIFLSFCIDIAIRSIKIAFLMLIAPIPILSMVNPEKGAKGMLSKWWEMAWATYLDLFLRLTSIYFIIYILTRVQDSGVWTQLLKAANGSVAVSVFAMVFIIIGGLLFAKQLPDMVVKLFPAMDGVVKGGFNPLKKMADAANVASRAPLVGKPLSAGGAKLAAMAAQNRANRKMAQQEKKSAAYQKAREAGKGRFGAALASTGIGRGVDNIKSGMKALNEQVKKDGGKAVAKEKAKQALDAVKSAPSKAFDNIASLHDDTLGVGAEAADAISWGGGDAKAVGFASAATNINKKSRQDIKKMQANAIAKAKAAETYKKVEGTATAERNDEIKEKEKQIVDVQREAEIQKRMKDPKFSNIDESQRRSAAEADLNQELLVNKKANEIMSTAKAQGKTMDEATAKAQAQTEVGKMSEKERENAVISQGLNTSENIMQATVNREASQMKGVSKEEALKAGKKTATEIRESAEEKIVGSLGDKMDKIAEQKGVIYNNAEYADQVRITREAKNRRNAIQSSYEKAARQQQFEGKVTTDDGRVLVGQEAIDYVDKLRVDYTKASGDYDFMNKELDKLAENYPEDAATRTLYEKEKDYQDKKKKVMKYASKSSQVSDNDREGGQYTVEELIGEDTLISRMRRADVEATSAQAKLVEQRGTLENERRILNAQLNDHNAAKQSISEIETEIANAPAEKAKIEAEIAKAPAERSRLEARLKLVGHDLVQARQVEQEIQALDASVEQKKAQIQAIDAATEQKKLEIETAKSRVLDASALADLQSKLNVNEVEIGRTQVGIDKVQISQENIAARLPERISAIEVKLNDLRTRTVSDAKEQAEIDLQISTLEKAYTEAQTQLSDYMSSTNGVAPITRDVNISGTDVDLGESTVHFDNIGTPIRNKVNNIIEKINAQKTIAENAQNAIDREKATMAVESAIAEAKKVLEEAGNNIYSGMSPDEKAAYEAKLSEINNSNTNNGQ